MKDEPHRIDYREPPQPARTYRLGESKWVLIGGITVVVLAIVLFLAFNAIWQDFFGD